MEVARPKTMARLVHGSRSQDSNAHMVHGTHTMAWIAVKLVLEWIARLENPAASEANMELAGLIAMQRQRP